MQRHDNSRTPLSDKLPLKTPLSLYVQASNICNFKCVYCSQSLGWDWLNKNGIEKGIMTVEMFSVIIDQIKAFREKLKVISLTGFGEPLVNPDLEKLIKMAKQADICDRIEIVTNATLLTEVRAEQICESGLDLIRVSIQGMTNEKYKQVSGADIDIKALARNLKHLYKHKKNTKIYIKILDSSICGDETEDMFYSMFGEYCDMISVEKLVPIMPDVDYKTIQGTHYNTGKQLEKNYNLDVCSRPFYMMLVDIDGSVRPCCSYKYPLILGNIKQETLTSIWNGEKMRAFRLLLLKSGIKSHTVCADCEQPFYELHQEDIIDGHRNELMLKYENHV